MALFEYKIVVFGGGEAGKSATTIQFVQNVFVTDYRPCIDDSYRKHFTVDEEGYLLEILDMNGEDLFPVMLNRYVEAGNGFVFVFSITSRPSFDKLANLFDTVKEIKQGQPISMVLLGNKCDLEIERQVSTEEGQELAQLFNCPYFETSAKDNINVIESYSELARIMRNNETGNRNK